MDSADSRQIIPALLRKFYELGWCAGSGGGISIRQSNECIYVAPSGVQKEEVKPLDLYKININGEILEAPKNKVLKPSECTPLFNAVYKLTPAGAVIHSHSVHAVLITRLFDSKPQFHTRFLEMIKGIPGHSNTDWCRVPIIENTEKECELTDRLSNAIIQYPRAHAVLVRNHGMYSWGANWERAKIIAECYDYLFQATLELQKLGIQYPIDNSIPDMDLRAWYLNDDEETKGKNQEDFDIRDPAQYRECLWAQKDTLEQLGVVFRKFDGDIENPQLKEMSSERGYKSKDEIKCGEHCSSNYQELLATFQKEHIHSDEEIRYILDGSGFFDVRDSSDQWIRIHSTKGNLIILPEGIYHRFTPDHKNYVHALRLFQDEPKWTPFYRPQEEHPSREKYLKGFLLQN